MNEPAAADDLDLARGTAWAEGVAALSVLVGMRTCVMALQAIDASDDALVRAALFSGIVVHYARSFENVTHDETGVSRRFRISEMRGAKFRRTIHDAMLTMRDKQVAHAGHGLNDFSLSFLRAKLSGATLPSGGAAASHEHLAVIGTRARASVACGIKGEDARAQLVAHMDELERKASAQLLSAMAKHHKLSMDHLKRCEIENRPFGKVLSHRQLIVPPGVLVLGEEDWTISLASGPEAVPVQFTVLSLSPVEQDGKVGIRVTLSERL